MLNESPDAGISPATKRVRDELRKEYQQIRTDLERYDRMQGYQTPAEFGAAALGQLGGTAFNAMFGTGLGHMARYGREMHIWAVDANCAIWKSHGTPYWSMAALSSTQAGPLPPS